MKPSELVEYLDRLVARNIKLSIMIWGPPGIGKSSIVAQTARAHGLNWIDLRLSQLAPTDLRGLPVPEDGAARWYPPEFLPRDGAGILFLDELNMAPPAIQGVAQQLILDRHVGNYTVPDGWFLWAAGNRKEDHAAVFDMPSPLANRFLHLEVVPDLESFRTYALMHNLHEQIIAFLALRPTLLHQLDPHHPAWPSPRSWEMASALHTNGLSIAPAVGAAATAEFEAFCTLDTTQIDLASILRGMGNDIVFPEDVSLRYALVTGLVLRAHDAEAAYHAFSWLATQAGPEWVQVYATDVFSRLRARGEFGALARRVADDPQLQQYLHTEAQLTHGQTSDV